MIETRRAQDVLLHFCKLKAGGTPIDVDWRIETLEQKSTADFFPKVRPTVSFTPEDKFPETTGSLSSIRITSAKDVPEFLMHKRAGGVFRYFIAGAISTKLLQQTVGRLIALEFSVFLIADLLEIDNKSFPQNVRILEALKRDYGTQQCFSSDFPVVALAHARRCEMPKTK